MTDDDPIAAACKRCGALPGLYRMAESVAGRVGGVGVACATVGCQSIGPARETLDKAIEEWNARQAAEVTR